MTSTSERRGPGVPLFDAHRGIMTVIVAAMNADLQSPEEGVRRIHTLCARSPIFAAFSKEDVDTAIGFADAVTDQFGAAAVDHAVAALTLDLRETAFAFCCDIVLANGAVTQDEERFLTELASRLAIPDNVIEAVIMAAVIRHRSLDGRPFIRSYTSLAEAMAASRRRD